MTGSDITMRLGTLNVRSLGGRLGGVLAIADSTKLNVLCLQETRVNAHSWNAVSRAVKARGWQLFPGPQGRNSKDVVEGGTLVLTKWPAEALALPDELVSVERAMAVKLYRPQQRPLILINVYLHASDRTAASQTLVSLFDFVAACGEDAIIMGDFNLETRCWPISNVLATGQWRSCDELVCGDQVLCGTHRTAAGAYTGVVIDYGLCTPRLTITGREQHLGPADHDAVVYSLHVPGSLPKPWTLPVGAPLHTDKIDEKSWQNAWEEVSSNFENALRAGSMDSAWATLSDCAESLLLVRGKPGRATRPGPQQIASPPSTKAPSLQNLKERKLRRFARRVVEYQKSPSPQLEIKLLRDGPHLHHSLASFSLDDHRLIGAALALADTEAMAASKQRVTAWKDSVQENATKLGKWVKQTPPEKPPASFEGPILPEDRAKREALAWENHWNPEQLPDLVQVDDLCSQLGFSEIPLQNHSLQVSGSDLVRVALKATKKAPGMDAWTALHLCNLPIAFWDQVGVLWDACLKHGRVPVLWKEVRIALLPKPTGGMRPLAIVTVLWRICMSATLKKLRPWISDWASPQLFGGLPGKGIMDVHERFHEAVSTAKQSRVDLVGCKADVRKCFDSVCPKIAIHVWRRLGAPSAVCDLLEDFYSDQRRWFAWQGSFHPHPVFAQQGLLQGCPASPALLNALMTVWVKFVKRQEPRVSLAIYLDDRTLWMKGGQSLEVVVNAMTAGAQADAILGFELHPDKLASFATKPHLMGRLRTVQDLVGVPTDTFTLLGIQYNLARPSACVDAEKVSDCIQRRCLKIRLAAQHLGTRIALVHQLVISLFAWSGAFHHFPARTIGTWTSMIETAIWGRRAPPGRSRLLFWNSLGSARLHPKFALHFTAARTEWIRQCRRAQGLPAAHSPAPRWKSLLKDWKWRIDDGLWYTPAGVLKPGWMTLKSLQKAAIHSWLIGMWTKDTKTQGCWPRGKVPVLQFQANAAVGMDYYSRRVLTGAAVDGRVTERLGSVLTCECGLRSPDREHLTFHCKAQPWGGEFKSATERRLLVPFVEAPPVLPFSNMVADPTLVSFLRQFDPLVQPTLGLDGSCIIAPTCDGWQRASWAVSGFSGPTVQGAVKGFEQTPAAGERAALLQACLASSAARRPVMLLIDNQALVLRLQRGISTGRWDGDLPLFWHRISDLLVQGTVCAWIPSHDKNPHWTPPAGWLDAHHCRALNATADVHAGEVLRGSRTTIAAAVQRHQRAVDWAASVWRSQRLRTLPYWQVLLDHQPFLSE